MGHKFKDVLIFYSETKVNIMEKNLLDITETAEIESTMVQLIQDEDLNLSGGATPAVVTAVTAVTALSIAGLNLLRVTSACTSRCYYP